MIEDIYKEEILDHYKDPRNFGKLDNATHNAREVNSLCGDHLELFIIAKDGIIEDVKFSGEGCAISQASCSMLTEKIKGKKMDEARKLKGMDIIRMLGINISPARFNCALLSLKTLQSAIKKDNCLEKDIN